MAARDTRGQPGPRPFRQGNADPAAGATKEAVTSGRQVAFQLSDRERGTDVAPGDSSIAVLPDLQMYAAAWFTLDYPPRAGTVQVDERQGRRD